MTRSSSHSTIAWFTLVGIGVAWALTGPLTKLTVSTGHHPVGLTLWSTIIGALVITAALYVRGGRLPVSRQHVVFFLVCGFLGTAFPNSLSFKAYQHLSVGVNVILISIVPMTTMVFALAFKLEQPNLRRLGGLVLGVCAVALITIPKTSLPDSSQVVWVVLPIVIALSYASENIYIAKAHPEDCSALTIMCGLYWGALVLLIPVTIAMGAWVDLSPLGTPELALIAVAILHLLAYLGFVWLIAHSGPVFASQVGYLVTGGGVFLGVLVFDEQHSLWVWLALLVMMAGLVLVKPQDEHSVM